MHDSWRNLYIPRLDHMPTSVLDGGQRRTGRLSPPYWRNPYATSTRSTWGRNYPIAGVRWHLRLWKADDKAPSASIDLYARTLSVKGLQPHTLRLVGIGKH